VTTSSSAIEVVPISSSSSADVTTKAAAKPDVDQAAVIGGAVGGGLLLIGLVGVGICLVRRRAKKSAAAKSVRAGAVPSSEPSLPRSAHYGYVPAAAHSSSGYELGQLKQVEVEEYVAGNI
jgi:hypothetical protein